MPQVPVTIPTHRPKPNTVAAQPTRIESAFSVSSTAATLALQASPDFAKEMATRKFLNGEHYEVTEEAAFVLGEEILGRIVMLRRHLAIDAPNSVIPLADAREGRFHPQLLESLLGYLNIPANNPYLTDIVSQITRDLASWVESNTVRAERLGLLIRDEAGRVFLRCERLAITI